MSNRGFTEKGQKALGRLIRNTRFSPEVRSQIIEWLQKSGSIENVPDPVNQKQFASWVSAISGIHLSESALGRLEKGTALTGPPLSILIALCKYMKILRLPDGSLCDLNRVAEILCGDLEVD